MLKTAQLHNGILTILRLTVIWLKRLLAISLHVHVSEIALPMRPTIHIRWSLVAIEILVSIQHYLDGTHTFMFKHV